MRPLVIILSVVGALGAIAGGLFWWTRKPKIEATKVDLLAPSVDYKMTAGGGEMSGKKMFKDKTTTQKEDGKYKFLASAEGKGIVLCIMKDGKIVECKTVDLTDKPGTISNSIPAGT